MQVVEGVDAARSQRGMRSSDDGDPVEPIRAQHEVRSRRRQNGRREHQEWKTGEPPSPSLTSGRLPARLSLVQRRLHCAHLELGVVQPAPLQSNHRHRPTACHPPSNAQDVQPACLPTSMLSTSSLESLRRSPDSKAGLTVSSDTQRYSAEAHVSYPVQH